jgi:hypothetical protein
MINEEQRRMILNTVAMSDAKQLEKYLNRRAELMKELSQIEYLIAQKTRDIRSIIGE